ncbi:MAG: UDP-glucose/GDP-mannose dehydrogenase family protein [Cocleimonas sp.]
MKITIYGSGYVGLVTSACMAQVGNEVLCIDIDENKIQSILGGSIPIYEPNLDSMVADSIASGRLTFSSSAKEGAAHGLYQFIAVGTPSSDDGSTDLTDILKVADSIAEHMDGYRIIANKSTTPVGTADKIRDAITQKQQELGKNIDFDMVANPEFLKEGAAIDDFMKPDRIIIGADNPRTIELMRELYVPFNHRRDRLVAMDIRSAELTKYAATGLLATKISFMNELANIAELLGADIEQVRIGIGSDPRIGYHFIYPGCGYGGTYFPKDIHSLRHAADQAGYDAKLLDAVDSVNEYQKERPFVKLQQYYGESLKDKTIALWGLSFKPNTDDMHSASSRTLMEALWNIGAKIRAYDPVALDECKRIYGERDDLTLCQSADETLKGADALTIVTEWQEFRAPNFNIIKTMLKDPVVIDGRNLYNPEQMKELGFTYFGIGRGE